MYAYLGISIMKTNCRRILLDRRPIIYQHWSRIDLELVWSHRPIIDQSGIDLDQNKMSRPIQDQVIRADHADKSNRASYKVRNSSNKRRCIVRINAFIRGRRY